MSNGTFFKTQTYFLIELRNERDGWSRLPGAYTWVDAQIVYDRFAASERWGKQNVRIVGDVLRVHVQTLGQVDTLDADRVMLAVYRNNFGMYEIAIALPHMWDLIPADDTARFLRENGVEGRVGFASDFDLALPYLLSGNRLVCIMRQDESFSPYQYYTDATRKGMASMQPDEEGLVYTTFEEAVQAGYDKAFDIQKLADEGDRPSSPDIE